MLSVVTVSEILVVEVFVVGWGHLNPTHINVVLCSIAVCEIRRLVFFVVSMCIVQHATLRKVRAVQYSTLHTQGSEDNLHFAKIQNSQVPKEKEVYFRADNEAKVTRRERDGLEP